jgi:hypothetical protein
MDQGRGAGEENAWDGAAGPRSAREAQAVKISRSRREVGRIVHD